MRFMMMVFALLTMATSAAAVTRTYECSVKNSKQRSWIQPLIFIAHNEDTGQVIVSDPAILGFNDGQPAVGKLVVNNAKRITVKWSVDMVSASNQKVTMNYRATYVKGNGQVNVSAQPKHYANTFNAGGTCKVGVLK